MILKCATKQQFCDADFDKCNYSGTIKQLVFLPSGGLQKKRIIWDHRIVRYHTGPYGTKWVWKKLAGEVLCILSDVSAQCFLSLAKTSLMVAVKRDKPCLLALVFVPSAAWPFQSRKSLITDYLCSTTMGWTRIGLWDGRQHTDNIMAVVR